MRLPGRPALPQLALYVHFPWCEKKCPYCDFNSHNAPERIPQKQYLDALCADLELFAAEASSRQVASVFIGGGTPSLIDPATIDSLLSNARMLLRILPMAEVTMEANPGTIEQGRFTEFAGAGVKPHLNWGAKPERQTFVRHRQDT